MNEFIVPYCERLIAGAEPLNTVSNAPFLLAVVYGLSKLYTISKNHPTEKLWFEGFVVFLAFAIGAGSALFHYAPSHLTHALDVGPFVVFAVLIAWDLFRHAEWSSNRIVTTYFLWIGASLAATTQSHILAHSLFYLPTLVLLIYVAVVIRRKDKKLYGLAALFAVALLFRALDLSTCSYLPFGTHILWHLFNALACALCLDLVLSNRHGGRAA